MSQLMFTPRRKNRLRLAESLLPSELIQPVPAELVDNSPALISVLEYMNQKNPALGELMQVLDLVEVGPSYQIAASGSAVERDLSYTLQRLQLAGPTALEPLPEIERSGLPAEIDVVTTVKLRSIAIRAIATDTSYSFDEAIARIVSVTRVSHERAASGLALMLQHQLIDITPSGAYYLSDSTPF